MIIILGMVRSHLVLCRKVAAARVGCFFSQDVYLAGLLFLEPKVIAGARDRCKWRQRHHVLIFRVSFLLLYVYHTYIMGFIMTLS